MPSDMTPTPPVAPDDEAHFTALQQCVSDSYGDDRDSQQVYEEGGKALEALRRRIAGLRARIDRDEAAITDLTIRTNSAEAALAACRTATIEECAAQAESLRHLDYSSESPEWCSGTEDAATAIRALKDKEPTNG